MTKTTTTCFPQQKPIKPLKASNSCLNTYLICFSPLACRKTWGILFVIAIRLIRYNQAIISVAYILEITGRKESLGNEITTAATATDL